MDRNERLLKEIHLTEWFSRVIVVYVNRGLQPTRVIDQDDTPYKFVYLHLWGVSREDVRVMATTLFQSENEVFITRVVDKVYDDLLGLCIPLTPSNVVMYLKILYREGEFHPLNRVDIVGRYLLELLRRPSDAYSETFNSKNKMDVLGAFVYKMYQDRKGEFVDKYWHDFASEHQSAILLDFNIQSFLQELLDAHILVRWGSNIFFKYNFFFSFFLGKHISSKAELLTKFLDEEEYLRANGVIDVITGISSDNTLILTKLVERLEGHLDTFYETYAHVAFDPLAKAVWPDNDAEEEELWKPVAAEIAAGPRSVAEMDSLKTSLFAEARTIDQEVRFAKFVELENALFHTGYILSDALRNSDDASGQMKLRAYDAVLRMHLTAFQIGAIFAPYLVKKRVFRWGGLAFIDFNRIGKDHDADSNEAITSVVVAVGTAVARKASEDLGSHKLAMVFQAREKDSRSVGFLDVVNFNSILAAKGRQWEETLSGIIQRSGKNAFYLSEMLISLMRALKNEVHQNKERDSLKKLVARIHAKRGLNKSLPGEKTVKKILSRLEAANHFNLTSATKQGDS